MTPPEDWKVCFDDEEEELAVNDLDSVRAVCCLYDPLELLATARAEDDLDLLTASLPCTAASDLDLATFGLDWNSRGGGRGDRGGEPLVCTTDWTREKIRFRNRNIALSHFTPLHAARQAITLIMLERD